MIKEFEKIVTALEKHSCIEDSLSYLRTLNFHFIDSKPFIELLELEEIPFAISTRIMRYQFMVREIGKWEYDFRFVIAVKVWGDKTSKLMVYYIDPFDEKLKFHKKIDKEWKDAEDINFRKMVKRWVFPDELTYDERRDLRSEHKKVINPRSKYTGSEWYHKWWPLVKFIENADEL